MTGEGITPSAAAVLETVFWGLLGTQVAVSPLWHAQPHRDATGTRLGVLGMSQG